MAYTDNDKKRKNRDFFSSVRNAFNGYILACKKEANLRIHLLATTLVVIFGFVCKISKFEWIAVILCIGAVISSELLNTAVEAVCDYLVGERYSWFVKFAKDTAAAAVLTNALISVIIGLIVFGPHLSAWLIKFLSYLGNLLG